MLTTGSLSVLLILLAFGKKTLINEIQRITDSDQKIVKKPTVLL